MSPRIDRELRMAYLLGRMTEEEREKIADSLFGDPAFAESMEETERDLLDRYARGELSAEDRAAVELRLLVSDRQKAKLRFSAAMAHRRGAAATRRTTGYLWWSTLAASLVIAAGLWALWPRHATNSAPNTQAQNRDVAPEQSKSSAETPAIFAALLSAGGTRDAARQEVRLPKSTGLLRFDLELDQAPAAPSYSVQLLRASQLLWTQDDVSPTVEAGQPILSVRVPASSLPKGSYEFLIRSKPSKLPPHETVYRFLVL